jgi:LuxR family transcriptional regulator, maltose regulon positive regulatory protein
MAQPLAQRYLYEVAGTVHHSKISPPRPPAVSRPALAQRLEDGVAGRLTLITAPAGWGKTSALAEWAGYTGVDVAWMCCDEADNNPTRFLRAIASAVDRVRPGTVADLFAMLRSARPLPTDQLLTALADAISEDPAPLALVFDDFHLIDHPELLAGIQDLFTTGPGNLLIVIASRTTPPWSLARRRAYGDVTELGVGDLAFSMTDIATMLGEDAADEDTVRLLHERSEGWGAGIQLAVLWLQRTGNPVEIVDSFRGNHRDIADYLAEEVFNRLPERTGEFLLNTSVLDKFTAALASAVTGDDDAASTLAQIEAQGLFLIPMDHERQWYRYHGIFKEFLQERLRRTMPQVEADLHRRAAAWYQSQGMLVEASDSLLRVGDATTAAGLVDQIAECLLLQQGETHTYLRLVEQLPSETLQALPSIQRFYAWGLVLTGRLDEAEALAVEFERHVSTDNPQFARFQRAEIASIRSRIAAYRADHETTISEAKRALDLAAPEVDWFRADALLSLGFAHRALGQIDQAADIFGQASRLGWKCNLAHAALWGARYQALTYVSQGRLQDAAMLVEEDMDRARRAHLDHGAAYAALLVGRGELRYERNDLAGARRDLTQALHLAQEVGDAKILMNVYVALALLEEAEARHDEARAAVRKAIHVFNGPSEKATEAWLALRRGDYAAVRRWIEWYRATEGDSPSLSCGETEQVMLGRALMATGSIAEGEAFLAELLRQAETTGRWGRALVIRMMLAVASDRTDDETAAFAHVRQVMELAMREHYVRTVLDEGPEFLRLLRRAARHDESAQRRHYAAVLLAAAGDASISPEHSSAPDTLIEPLTVRQEEILRLMMDGHSNREIADALFVAEGTIKAHVHQIYGKLMVRNRAEAIRAAHDLKLVS